MRDYWQMVVTGRRFTIYPFFFGADFLAISRHIPPGWEMPDCMFMNSGKAWPTVTLNSIGVD